MHLLELVATPRWAPLAAFVARWYAEPLGAGGLDDAALPAIEVRLGRALPPRTREWLTLVGHRLQHTNQDQPVLPDQLAIRDGRLPLWWENQGNWSLDVELEGDESTASVLGETFGQQRRADVCDALAGMVISDTLVAAWGRGRAPLGDLAHGVVGGCSDGLDVETDAAVARLPRLGPSVSPYYDELRGHDALIVRGSSGAWEWMSVTDRAFREACAIFRVDPTGGLRHLELRFEDAPPSARALIQTAIEGELSDRLGARMRTASYDPAFAFASIQLETREPERLLQRVLSLLDDESRAALRAEHRPPHVSHAIPLWPR